VQVLAFFALLELELDAANVLKRCLEEKVLWWVSFRVVIRNFVEAHPLRSFHFICVLNRDSLSRINSEDRAEVKV